MKLKAVIILIAVAVAVAGAAFIFLIPSSNLREENQALRLQIDQAAELQADNDRLSNFLAQTKSSQSLPKEQMSELLRLRGEIGTLRRLTNEIGKLQAANERLLAASKARSNGPWVAGLEAAHGLTDIGPMIRITNPDFQPSHSLGGITNITWDPSVITNSPGQ